MTFRNFSFQFEEYSSDEQLNSDDKQLLQQARAATQLAYAPYSGFMVGAAALLTNGKIVTGSNQENASFPTGICAERSLLASAAQLFPNIGVESLAISYVNMKGNSDEPITPCGFCRQVLCEYEIRLQTPMRVILGGNSGKVIIIPTVSQLLPLRFQLQTS